MSNFNIQPDELYHSIKRFQGFGCGCLYFENQEYHGRLLTVDNQELVNLANCSYLALEKHEALIRGSQDALLRYGTQNSMSRNILSNPLYRKAELLLSEIFNGHPIIYSSTTQAHYSALPLLVQENDAIILDAFVHNSVRTASELCRAKGTFVIISKHNDVDHLQYIISRLKREGYRNIWYCADGVYSIHGDVCDVKGLHSLLDKEENFYAYVDDAHGVGWTGTNGSGYVIGNFGLHPKMIVTGSLSKSFATSGGFIIVKDEKIADYLKLRGNTFIFSIPMAPAVLGAIVASLELHLSTLINNYQNDLSGIINYFRKKCQEYSIPIFSNDVTPIQFIKIGSNDQVIEFQRHLVNLGFFAPIAAFPAVRANEGGLRFSISRHLTHADIDNLITGLQKSIISNHPEEKDNSYSN